MDQSSWQWLLLACDTRMVSQLATVLRIFLEDPFFQLENV